MEKNQVDEAVKSAKKTVNGYWWLSLIFIAAWLVFAIFNENILINLSENAKVTVTSIYYIYLLASIPFSFYFFHKKTPKWAEIDNVDKKIGKYKKGASNRIGIIMSVAFFGIRIYGYLTRDHSLVYCIAITVVALLFCRTSEKQIYDDLKLTNDKIETDIEPV